MSWHPLPCALVFFFIIFVAKQKKKTHFCRLHFYKHFLVVVVNHHHHHQNRRRCEVFFCFSLFPQERLLNFLQINDVYAAEEKKIYKKGNGKIIWMINHENFRIERARIQYNIHPYIQHRYYDRFPENVFSLLSSQKRRDVFFITMFTSDFHFLSFTFHSIRKKTR